MIVRADATPAMGIGHVMRLLALAEAHVDRGGSVVFAVNADAAAAADALKRRCLPVYLVHSASGSVGDAGEMSALAETTGSDVVVVDGYHFPPEYFANLRERELRAVAVDDTGASRPEADLVLDPDDPAFVLLRREFTSLPHRLDPTAGPVRRLLVTFGGSDPARGTAWVLRALPVGGPPVVTAVVGQSYRDDGELDAAARAAATRGYAVELLRGVTDMAALMATVDASVSAAGVTLWELAYMGVPTLAFTVADNQDANAATLANRQCIVNGGRLAHCSDEQISRLLARLVGDATLRTDIASRFGRLIDGRGAARSLARIDAIRRRATAA